MSKWHDSLPNRTLKLCIVQIKYLHTNLIFDLDGGKTGNKTHLF